MSTNQSEVHSPTLFVITRAWSAFVICMALAEFAVGGRIFSFMSNSNFGAWWVGIPAFLSGIFGCVPTSLAATSGFSVVTVIMGFIGSLVDGINYLILERTRACYEPSSNTYYGNDAYYDKALSCFSDINHIADGYCYCVQGGDSTLCYHYQLSFPSSYNCGSVMSYYRVSMHDSTILCSVMTVSALFFSCFACAVGMIRRPAPLSQSPAQNQSQQQVYSPPVVVAQAVVIGDNKNSTPSQNPYFSEKRPSAPALV